MTVYFWDPDGKYGEGTLKEYQYWVLAVGYRQHTLGSFVVIIKEQGIEKFSELRDEQALELKQIFGEIEQALLTNPIFKPDRFNYLQLGNAVNLLHYHGIPRYSASRTFAGQEWNDPTFGQPPVWKKDEFPKELIVQIRDEIKKFLP